LQNERTYEWVRSFGLKKVPPPVNMGGAC